MQHLWFYQFGRGAALPLTPEDEVAAAVTPSSEDGGPGPSNSGRYVPTPGAAERPKLSRQARVTEEPSDLPFADDPLPFDTHYLSRHKSVSECVHFSRSCGAIAETSFTIPIQTNKVDHCRPISSKVVPSGSEGLRPKQDPDEYDLTPSEYAECSGEDPSKPLRRQDSEGFCVSDRSLTPTEDLVFYTDCQALANTSTATDEDIFYSQLENLSLSSISFSDDLPTDADGLNQSTFCCDIFTPGLKEDAKSVLEEEDQMELTPAVALPSSHVQNHFSDCFPI